MFDVLNFELGLDLGFGLLGFPGYGFQVRSHGNMDFWTFGLLDFGPRLGRLRKMFIGLELWTSKFGHCPNF